MKTISKKISNFSLGAQRLYPHLKLTCERFPRLLVTRKIESDGAEYFGAFLPETGVRFLIDFLNKTFRLRSCEIEIDGSFNVPCTQFYRQRCVAPCVASLCDATAYAAQVDLVRLFLLRKTAELKNRFLQKIEDLAADLNFEKAGEQRDVWLAVEKVFADKRWNLWLEDAIDTFEIEETEQNFLVCLVTMRGRKNLGRRVYIFEKKGLIENVLPAIIPQFYLFHAPKEIRISHDFAERLESQKYLSERFNRQIKIVVIDDNNRKITASRSIDRTKFEYDLRQLKTKKNVGEIQSEIKKTFNLSKKPRRIEGFDVAHISGENFVAAKSVWENGKLIGKEYEFWLSDEKSELETLRKFIEFRFRRLLDKNQTEKFPDLILIDGGRAQLQAALKGLESLRKRYLVVISAVKPPKQHGKISHFLLENGEAIKFSTDSAAHKILQILRDEAHDLSNQVHRQRREMSHFYELAAIFPALPEKERLDLLKKFGSVKKLLQIEENDLAEFPAEKNQRILQDLLKFRQGETLKIEPLIVPIRFDDENGDAQDLRPLSGYK